MKHRERIRPGKFVVRSGTRGFLNSPIAGKPVEIKNANKEGSGIGVRRGYQCRKLAGETKQRRDEIKECR